MINDKEHIFILLLEYIEGTISDGDRANLLDAIKENNEIALLYEELKAFHFQKGEAFSNQINEDKAWQNTLFQINDRNHRVKTKMSTWWLPIAAAAFLGVVFVSYKLFINSPENKVDTISKYIKPAPLVVTLALANGTKLDLSRKETIVIGNKQLNSNGQQLNYKTVENNIQEWSTLTVPKVLDYKLVLADGTQVWLNSSSNIRFPFTFPGNTREVYLHGEAFFKVSKNAQKPFIVHTEHTDITVLGTSFNVNTYNADRAETSLIEGSVKTTANDNEILLKPGFQAVYEEKGGFSVVKFDQDDVTSWLHGVFYFHDTKLEQIARVLPRWFAVDVVFDDQSAKALSFSGAIEKNKSLDTFLANLKATAGVDSYFKANTLHLKAN
jgi:hypothetical protein